jgi:hypothetical protein
MFNKENIKNEAGKGFGSHTLKVIMEGTVAKVRKTFCLLSFPSSLPITSLLSLSPSFLFLFFLYTGTCLWSEVLIP